MCFQLFMGKCRSTNHMKRPLRPMIQPKMKQSNKTQQNLSVKVRCGTRWVDGTPTTEVRQPRSLSPKSIHLTLVTKWSWSWSWMTYCHPLCAISIGPPILRYSYFKIWPWKSMLKVMCGQRSRSRLTFKIQRSRLWSRTNPLVTLEKYKNIKSPPVYRGDLNSHLKSMHIACVLMFLM